MAGWKIGRDQPHIVYPSAAHDVNGSSDLHELDRIVTPDESDFLSTPFENILKARTQIVPGNVFLINQDLIAGSDLHHNRLRWIGILFCLRRWLGQGGFHSLGGFG